MKLTKTEKEMLHNVFKFSDLTAKQVMVPRTDMACISSDISVEELNKLTVESQYTRYPVYEENMDHITGIIHVKDLYGLTLRKGSHANSMRATKIWPKQIHCAWQRSTVPFLAKLH